MEWQEDRDAGSVHRRRTSTDRAASGGLLRIEAGPDVAQRRRPDRRLRPDGSTDTMNRPMVARIVDAQVKAATITVQLSDGSNVAYNTAAAQFLDCWYLVNSGVTIE
jgi:hypothetical protein